MLIGRSLTSYPWLRTDLRNAGAAGVDQEVHVDRGLVSSRTSDDLPAFSARIVEEFSQGRHQTRSARPTTAGCAPRRGSRGAVVQTGLDQRTGGLSRR